MENNEMTKATKKSQLWLSHALVAVITVVILVVLLAIQPWSNNAITIVHSFRMSLSASMSDGVDYSESMQEIMYTVPNHYYIIGSMEGIEQKIIVIGRDVYTNERQSAGYITFETIAQGVASISPGEEHTERVLADFADIEELENQEISGVICRHYRGSIDMAKDIKEQIAGLDPKQPNYESLVAMLEAQIEAMQEIKTSIELWVGEDDGLVRQLIYEAELSSDELGQLNQVQHVRYSDINLPIAIEAPLDGSGELLPGWYMASPPLPAPVPD